MSDDTNEIVWEDPPAHRTHGNARWVDRLYPMLVRPGKWGRIKEYAVASTAGSAASTLRLGKCNIPDGKWEFRASGKFVYARYLGPEE